MFLGLGIALLISIGLFFNSFLVWICIVVLISIFFLTYINWLSYRRYCGNLSPNLLINLKRDYTCIYLGVETTKKQNDYLDLSNANRNLYTNIEIVKRFYSLLSENGKVLLEVFDDRYYVNSHKISCFDFCLLHPITVFEHGKYLYSYVYRFKEFFTGNIFVFRKIIKKKCRRCNANDIENLIILLNDLSNFTISRSIKVEIKLNNFSQKNIQLIKNNLNKEITLLEESENV